MVGIKAKIRNILFRIPKIYFMFSGIRNILSPPPPRNTIKNFYELDEFVKQYIKQSSKDLLQEKILLSSYSLDFESFYKLFGSRPQTIDPFSDEYRKWEIAFFEFLSGKKYQFSNEGINDENLFSRHPFIEMGYSPSDVIKRLHLYIDLLSILKKFKIDSVLEMGCGWGTLGTLIESAGLDYYAIDASEKFVRTARKLIYSEKIKTQIMCKSFYDIADFKKRFDVVIFEASFHHCGEPLRILNLLYENTTPEAKLIFLNEPIGYGYTRPWGVVRNDGESILQIRMRGWLELGYRTDFFREALRRSGFESLDIRSSIYSDNPIFIASKNKI